ncbi:hypothetical protein GCK32_011007 [Trichostrongylus colubriformis]|uniref:Uncharacterized protein n=1 Tax=Trichostrongylus colubriformis TaxID=6319 RepID=A0AAN8FAF7_TRICO
MYSHRRSPVEFPLHSTPPLYHQKRPLMTESIYRRKAAAVSFLWYAPPYPVITPTTRSEHGPQSTDENLPGYVEKVLEWFRKNDEYNRRMGKTERSRSTSAFI